MLLTGEPKLSFGVLRASEDIGMIHVIVVIFQLLGDLVNIFVEFQIEKHPGIWW